MGRLKYATRLKYERVNKKMSIRELAEKSGVNKTTIQRIESGEVSPSVDTLEKILNAMSLNLKIERLGAKKSAFNWISVEDKLPPHDKREPEFSVRVFVCTRSLHRFSYGELFTQVTYYNYDRGEWAIGVNTEVTHWMPLPPLPSKNT